MAGLCEGGNEPSGSLKAISDEPREFNLPTLPQKYITYEVEKLPTKYGVHSEEYVPTAVTSSSVSPEVLVILNSAVVGCRVISIRLRNYVLSIAYATGDSSSQKLERKPVQCCQLNMNTVARTGERNIIKQVNRIVYSKTIIVFEYDGSVTRGACKELIGLPHDCPDGMFYSPKKYRGLSLMKASWEAYVQHINICNTVLRVDDCHLHIIRDLVSEKVSALLKLNITTIDAINWSGRKIRKHLRNDAFQTWTNHTLRGKGVIVYSDLPKANSWVSNRKGLSSSEWTNALKMSSNIWAVRAIPGRTLSTTRCRHPDCSELETLGHVLGQCPKGELLINARHHRVRHALTTSLKTLNWEIHEEVHCVSSDGSNGRLKRALVLNPTIRFERNLNQATEVDIEKKSIYEPCLPYLSQKYNVPLKQWPVIGLLFGSRACDVTYHTGYGASSGHPPSELPSSLGTIDCAVASRVTCSILLTHRPFAPVLYSQFKNIDSELCPATFKGRDIRLSFFSPPVYKCELKTKGDEVDLIGSYDKEDVNSNEGDDEENYFVRDRAYLLALRTEPIRAVDEVMLRLLSSFKIIAFYRVSSREL
ncbi:hypothetical protein ANN_25776 [Periplaneta americana]|uniref:Reverse transcriptase n=1 Tax=Periplaneta americana TaxID=6978 RepID=A0ABQ8S4B1_PERAM|nr:hypothetical protein ANN_25776 [Periplaneta americana]